MYKSNMYKLLYYTQSLCRLCIYGLTLSVLTQYLRKIMGKILFNVTCNLIYSLL